MLYDNCWAIKSIAVLLLTFMSHMRPVPSQQRGLCGLSPPKTQIMHQGPQIENENYKLVEFCQFVHCQGVNMETKTHSNHNVGLFSPQTH